MSSCELRTAAGKHGGKVLSWPLLRTFSQISMEDGMWLPGSQGTLQAGKRLHTQASHPDLSWMNLGVWLKELIVINKGTEKKNFWVKEHLWSWQPPSIKKKTAWRLCCTFGGKGGGGLQSPMKWYEKVQKKIWTGYVSKFIFICSFFIAVI